MSVAPASGRVALDAHASRGRALVLTGVGPARGSLRAASRSRLLVSARSNDCGGPSQMLVVVDGRAHVRTVGNTRWRALAAATGVAPGAHRVVVRLLNPKRSASCRRALRIDRIWLAAAAAAPASGGPGIWRPARNTTWQWQLTTPVDQSVPAAMYDIDLFDNSAAVVASLHAKGRRVVCYLSAGSFENGRPDSGSFPAAVLGNQLDGWPNERWLDLRRLDLLRPIMEHRLDLCQAKGFDGVEADNVDGYANASGFPLTAANQLAYNRFLASAAHARGLSIGLKNDLAQVPALEPSFDFAINEQCFQYSECGTLQPFLKAGKAVFNVEYDLTNASFCPKAAALGTMSMRKNLALDAPRWQCW
jgi:hypothetical protein